MKKVIAVDFDGTLFEDRWPEIGEPIWPVINAAKKESQNGTELILWTTREGEKLTEALEACGKVGLRFDAVNSNTESRKLEWGNDPRKIGADEYWDDRAVPVKSFLQEPEQVNEIVKALHEECSVCSENHWCDHGHSPTAYCPLMDAADLIESLQARLASSQNETKVAVEDIERLIASSPEIKCSLVCDGDCVDCVTSATGTPRGYHYCGPKREMLVSETIDEVQTQVILKSGLQETRKGELE